VLVFRSEGPRFESWQNLLHLLQNYSTDQSNGKSPFYLQENECFLLKLVFFNLKLSRRQNVFLTFLIIAASGMKILFAASISPPEGDGDSSTDGGAIPLPV
jgi:hypothetical protein